VRFCVWAWVTEGMRRGGAVSCWLLDDEPCVMEGKHGRGSTDEGERARGGARGSSAWGREGAVGCLVVEVGHDWVAMVKSQKNRRSSGESTPHPPKKKSVSYAGRPRHTIP